MEYTVYQPYENIYHFRDPLGVNFTLVKGDKLAILLDTGYGLGNIRELIENIITTPYVVINSHGHMDHTCGNYLFDTVYINQVDNDLCINHNGINRRLENIERAKSSGLIDNDYDVDNYINKGPGNLKPLNLNERIDLGNLTIKIISMTGHTKGCIGLLIEEMRLLLSADSAILNIWLFLEESTSKDEYIKMLERVIEEPFDNFITGHISRVFPKKYFEYFIEVAKEANVNNSNKIRFKGFERENTYQYLKKINNDLIGISFYQDN